MDLLGEKAVFSVLDDFNTLLNGSSYNVKLNISWL